MVNETSSAGTFEELALPLMRSLFNYAQSLTRNQSDAEDIVQDSFIKAHRAFHRLRPGSDFRAWMFAIVRNTFLSSKTRAYARLTQSIDDAEETIEPVTNVTPESIAMADVDECRIRTALDSQSAVYREVIVLCDVEEMKYREIAEVLHIPVGTVMSRIARARRQLREALTATCK
jgi:RNA polymerase sigma-70 factor (ECF subfamily)